MSPCQRTRGAGRWRDSSYTHPSAPFFIFSFIIPPSDMMEHGKKILMIVMDGLGDRAVKSLDYRTPLQCARKPNLDWFASNGTSGIMDVIAPGIRPGSDTSHLALLGYDPYKVYTGRGPFEAAGVGLVGKAGDVAFRCNFATVDSRFNVLDRRAGRIKEPDTTELAKALDGMNIGDIKVVVREATEHRAVLMLQGRDLSPRVSDADPHALTTVQTSRPLGPDAARTSEAVNEFVRRSYEVLNDHPVNERRASEGLLPANILLPRGAGVFPDIQPFPERYEMSASGVAGVSLIRGICRVCGLEVIEPPGCTGGMDTDMEAKTCAALKELDRKDFVLMNVKASDVTSHDGDPSRKIETIERLDGMARIIRKDMPEGTVVALMADHCTPVELGDHSGDPVPLTIYTENSIKDGTMSYDEVSCARGALGRIRGMDLMPILLDKADRAEKFGA